MQSDDMRRYQLRPLEPTQTLESLVYERLREAMVAGHLAAGERLVLSLLAKSLGVSRVPVTQALKRLETQGYVRTNARGEVQVFDPTADDLRELTALHERLVSLAARFAALRATPAEVEHIEALAERVAKLSGMERVVADREFHAAVAAAGKMKRLMSMIELVRDHVEMARNALADRLVDTVRDPSYYATSNHEHRELVAALRRRDADAAEEMERTQSLRAGQVKLRALDAEPTEESIP